MMVSSNRAAVSDLNWRLRRQPGGTAFENFADRSLCARTMLLTSMNVNKQRKFLERQKEIRDQLQLLKRTVLQEKEILNKEQLKLQKDKELSEQTNRHLLEHSQNLQKVKDKLLNGYAELKQRQQQQHTGEDYENQLRSMGRIAMDAPPVNNRGHQQQRQIMERSQQNMNSDYYDEEDSLGEDERDPEDENMLNEDDNADDYWTIRARNRQNHASPQPGVKHKKNVRFADDSYEDEQLQQPQHQNDYYYEDEEDDYIHENNFVSKKAKSKMRANSIGKQQVERKRKKKQTVGQEDVFGQFKKPSRKRTKKCNMNNAQEEEQDNARYY